MSVGGYPLLCATSAHWAEQAYGGLGQFLNDHACCERKAMASALSFISRFPGEVSLVEPMMCIAKEELAHFHDVYRIIKARGLTLNFDVEDLYVKELRKAVRHDHDGFLLDRLLVAALIEARSSERLRLFGEWCQKKGHELAGFYLKLAKTEMGHWRGFYNQARIVSCEAVERLVVLSELESEIVKRMPLRPAVH